MCGRSMGSKWRGRSISGKVVGTRFIIKYDGRKMY